LIVLLLVVSIGLPLRRELQCPGVDDATLIRSELRRREWEAAR